MINKLWFTFLFPIFLIAYDFHDFDCYQNRFTRGEVKERIERYLEKDSSIQKFYQITPDALDIGDESHPDYVLVFKKTPSINSSDSQMPKSLKGFRVALDPGHLGGEYAEIEKRCIVISDFHLHEGDMAYLTALKLKELLEGEGGHCDDHTYRNRGRGLRGKF